MGKLRCRHGGTNNDYLVQAATKSGRSARGPFVAVPLCAQNRSFACSCHLPDSGRNSGKGWMAGKYLESGHAENLLFVGTMSIIMDLIGSNQKNWISDMHDTVSRAFDLAKNGECQSIHEIETRLSREGHVQAQEHLFGKSIRRQLSKLIHEKRATPKSSATIASIFTPVSTTIGLNA